MRISICAGIALGLACHATAVVAADKPGAGNLERGRYLVKITGCNDCHTPGYAESGGKVPQSRWLVGDKLGFRGPWGTTYATNLRLWMSKLTEAQWVEQAKSLKTRPPMPWFNVQALSEADLRSMYAFVKSLGPAGEPAPQYVPPDQEPKPPFIQWPSAPK